jgi:hypothetical protein
MILSDKYQTLDIMFPWTVITTGVLGGVGNY